MKRLTGHVEERRVGRGTKSEHTAVVLQTPDRVLRLRRRGGLAYDDAVLKRLVGKTITCEGTVHGHTLIIDHWTAKTLRKADKLLSRQHNAQRTLRNPRTRG